MDLGLKGKVALVSGGNRGIGAATAAALAAEGARLTLTARDRAKLDETAAALRAAHSAAVECHAADLTDAAGADGAVAACIEAHGRIDVLVCAAGASQGGRFEDLSDTTWRDSLELKFMATIRLMRAALPAMRAGGGGRIVVITGNLARQPDPRLLPGAAANAALQAVIVGLAQEAAADGVQIVAVSPGPTRSERWSTLMDNLGAQEGVSPATVEQRFAERIPLGRLNDVDEVGRVAAFMCSPASGAITGSAVTIDGGFTKGV